MPKKSGFMHFALITLLVLQSATVIDVQANSEVTLAVQLGDTIYTAEFSNRDLKPDIFRDGDRVQAEVKNGKLNLKLRDGKKVSAPIHWVQKIVVHPHS